jgi:hypothetical protein
MKYTLEAPFKSISGTIERKRLRDGRVITIYARKDGVIAKRTYYPRGTVGVQSGDGPVMVAAETAPQ